MPAIVVIIDRDYSGGDIEYCLVYWKCDDFRLIRF